MVTVVVLISVLWHITFLCTMWMMDLLISIYKLTLNCLVYKILYTLVMALKATAWRTLTMTMAWSSYCSLRLIIGLL